MDLEFSGKVAVVTGASKGIGLAVVRTLAAEEAEVIAGARTVDTLEGLEGGPRSKSTWQGRAGPSKAIRSPVTRFEAG